MEKSKHENSTDPFFFNYKNKLLRNKISKRKEKFNMSYTEILVSPYEKLYRSWYKEQCQTDTLYIHSHSTFPPMSL